MRKVSAIILSAGEGKRFAKSITDKDSSIRVKQLLPFNNRTIIDEVLSNFVQSKVSEIILVLGYRADVILEHLKSVGNWQLAITDYRLPITNYQLPTTSHPLPIKAVMNPLYEQGMSQSIIVGLSATDIDTSAIIIAHCDMPYISTKIIDQLIDAYDSSEKGIVYPVYKGRQGHPVIISLKYADEIKKLKGDKGAKEIINRYKADTITIEVDNDCILKDIDTMGEYRTLE